MRVATGLALMLTFTAGYVRGQGAVPAEQCAGPSIVLEPPLDHRRSWTRAADDTRRRVAELPDVDACTRLEIEATDDSVRVRASAADGRSVVRDVSKPSELEATVVALLVLPPSARDDAVASANGVEASGSITKPADAASPKTAPAAPAPKPSPRRVETPDERDHGARLPGADAASGHALELALAGSGRSTGYLFGAGASGVIDWDLGGWLVGGAVHAEQVSGPSDVTGRFGAERNASFGAVVGRRLVQRPFYLDVMLEAPILALHTSTWTSHPVVTSPGESETDDPTGETDDGVQQTTTARTRATPANVDLRAGGFVRAVVPFAGRFGAALSADGERSLGLVHAPNAAGQPAALPWNFGLSLGLFWSGG